MTPHPERENLVCLLQDVEFEGATHKAGDIANIPDWFLRVSSVQYVPADMQASAREALGIKPQAPQAAAQAPPSPKPVPPVAAKTGD